MLTTAKKDPSYVVSKHSAACFQCSSSSCDAPQQKYSTNCMLYYTLLHLTSISACLPVFSWRMPWLETLRLVWLHLGGDSQAQHLSCAMDTGFGDGTMLSCSKSNASRELKRGLQQWFAVGLHSSSIFHSPRWIQRVMAFRLTILNQGMDL